MARRDVRMLLALAAIVAAWALTQHLADLQSMWLTMAPALLIAVPLLSGRYVGAEVIERCVRRDAPPRRRPATPSISPRPPRATRGGGLLVARRLAGRAPPALASVS